MRRAMILAALLALAPAAPAASQEAPSLEGTFVYDAGRSDNVNRAIETVTARMNFALRPIARGRLRRTNQPYQRVSISHTSTHVTIATDQRAPLVTPANGAPVDWTRPEDGEKLKVSTEWENGRLEQTFMAEDGRRVNTYSISPDGRTLTLEVAVSSPRLRAPLTYTLRYRRAQ